MDLTVERAVAGGLMIARHAGRIVLVSGAIPGERVRVRVDRERRDVLHATTVAVLEADPDRRMLDGDPACGGQVYRHIAYPRQCRLKAELIRDALIRIGKVTHDRDIVVAPSPELGYRLRARLHVGARGLGFRREGSHQVCNVRGTGQLLAETVAVIEEISGRLPGPARRVVRHVEVAENIAGTERVVHYQLRSAVAMRTLAKWTAVAGVTGVTARVGAQRRMLRVRGSLTVEDPMETLVGRPQLTGSVARRAPTFFQANRYLLPRLVDTVCRRCGPGPVVDLYAGAGLFSLALAALGRDLGVAVERDPDAVVDLRHNREASGRHLEVHACSVEDYLAKRVTPLEGPVVVDPPRAGLSSVVIDHLSRLSAAQIVYVSCDVATCARDVARLTTAGYSLDEIVALDMFPNTAHVELVATLMR